MEGAFGLPGTVAGAVVMNASCFDFVTADVVTSVLALVNGKITELKNADCDFGYRTSRFRREDIIILRVEFTLKKGQSGIIQEKMSEVMSCRRKNQPSLPSAGSVFKNLSDKKVAKLIDDAGFKGYTIGGAKVSEVHANFIVNNGNATADDVRTIICDISKHFSEENVQLENEIIQIDKMGEEYDFIR